MDEKVAFFFAAIERVDQSLGKLRQVLQDEGLSDNTLLLFMTDNGGTAGANVYNAGMRGIKGFPYDGGHRVPLFIHWPAGKISHGHDVDDLTAHFDVLPTLIDLLDLKPGEKVQFDGRSFKQQLFEPQMVLPERTLFVERQRTFTPEKWVGAAAMTRQWRLVDNQELYDIQNDPGQENNLIDQHPEVVKQLIGEFDEYWRHVSPGDRDQAIPIVGHDADPETYLSSSDWHEPTVPWNHAQTSKGPKLTGNWQIETHTPGTYRFEVRRWPKEVDAPIGGVPTMEKTVDAWDAQGEKSFLIYADSSNPFKALPVASIRCSIGNLERVEKVSSSDTKIVFDFPLESGEYEISAEMLDKDGRLIARAYYTYCWKLDR